MHQFSDETKEEAYRRNWLEDDLRSRNTTGRNKPHQSGLIGLLIGFAFTLVFGLLGSIVKAIFGKR